MTQQRPFYKTWRNDWDGVLGASAERFLRNNPNAVAVLAFKDEHGRLCVEEYATPCVEHVRGPHNMPHAYSIAIRHLRTSHPAV